VPVFMSAVAYIPGNLVDEHVARLKADISAAYPAGAVLVFNRPAGWLLEQCGAGFVYGGLLWSDNVWSDFVLRPDGGLDDALAQRGYHLAHPDAPTLTALGFAGASGILHSLAAHLEGFEPDEVDVKFLRSANGWLMPLIGVGALDRSRARWPKIPSCYAMTGWRRTEFGRPAANIRLSTATPTAASVCWAAKPRARSRGPISAL